MGPCPQVKDLVKAAYQRAKRVLSQHEKDLHLLAKELLDKETLSGEQIKKLLNLTSQARRCSRCSLTVELPVSCRICPTQDLAVELPCCTVVVNAGTMKERLVLGQMLRKGVTLGMCRRPAQPGRRLLQASVGRWLHAGRTCGVQA